MKSPTELLRWASATDPGRVRTDNEDDLVAEGAVFGVADGMGGHLAGEIAAQMAADRLRQRLSGGAAHPDAVVATVMEANAAIFAAAHSNLEQRGMGTTLTALTLLHDGGDGERRLAIVNVGDSRTYLMRGGRLRRVTTDHSYVQELVATGHITEQEARSHPRRNIVTRALGIEPLVRVDTQILPLVRGDRFVLCSDGLVDEVDDGIIAGIVGAHDDPQAVADGLVAAANDAGGRDNITVVVVDVLQGAEPPAPDDDLDIELGWAEEEDTDGEPHLIANEGQGEPDLVGSAPIHRGAAPPPTAMLPAVAPRRQPRQRRRISVGSVLFAITLVLIATVTAVLVKQVVDKGDVLNIVPATTTEPSTTTSTTTSTTSTTVVGATTTLGGP